MHSWTRRLFVAAALSGAAYAGDINGPWLGFAAGPDDLSLWPILGIPGATVWGKPVDFGPNVERLAISPRIDFAIAVTSGGVRTASLSPNGVSTLSDPGLPAGFRPTTVAFSPGGSVAALFDGTALWILGGGRNTPVDLSALPSPISKLAVSDGATLAAIGQEANLVYIFDSSGEFRALDSLGRVSAIAFLANSSDLVIADRGTGRLLRVRNPMSGSAPELLMASAQSRPHAARDIPMRAREGPVDVASSADGAALAVVWSNSEARLLNLASGEWTSFPCDCSQPALGRLRGSAVFRLSGQAGAAFQILDGDATEPRVVFVPPANAPGDLP